MLKSLGLPPAQQNDRSALTLLALASITPGSDWSSASSRLLRTVDMMAFMQASYAKRYAANSRETIRRQTLHQFIEAGVAERNPDDPSRPTNSGNNCYALTSAALSVVKRFGKPDFEQQVERFLSEHPSLAASYRQTRSLVRVPIQLPDGSSVHLSAGEHNQLQRQIIEQFAPRFAPGAALLYLGDTAKKNTILDQKRLAAAAIRFSEHDKLPDIVLLQEDKGWLYLIEAVTSHGPVTQVRMNHLRSIAQQSAYALIFVSAFPDRNGFRVHVADIAWETEVWIADQPDHLVHFNGHKFLGPYERTTALK